MPASSYLMVSILLCALSSLLSLSLLLLLSLLSSPSLLFSPRFPLLISPSLVLLLCFSPLLPLLPLLYTPLLLLRSLFSVVRSSVTGPVRSVIPYLTRRLQENQDVLGGTQLERQLLWLELKRRFCSYFGYNI